MGDDDSEIPTHEVVQHVITKKTLRNRRVKAPKGNAGIGLTSSGEAEDADTEIAVADENVVEATSKRKCHPNARYAEFWRHANDLDEDMDVPGLK
jgi:hypothetical protein